jgi:hypothetical protein
MASSPHQTGDDHFAFGQQGFHVALFRRGATHARQNIAELGDMTQMAPLKFCQGVAVARVFKTIDRRLISIRRAS